VSDFITAPTPIDDHHQRPRTLRRRTFLLSLGALSGGAVLLAACGGTSSTATVAPASSAAPSAAAVATTAPTTGAAATTASGTSATAATTTTGSATTAATSVSPAAATASRAATSATASGTAQDASPAILAAANAFIATLSDAEKKTGLFAWTDTAQKQRWSNFPPAGFKRAGLMWGNLNAAAQNAWLVLMQATMSPEGYSRVRAEWAADDALAASEGTGGGFGMANYYIALIGTPSATDPWQWQWGGHHVTVNATIVGANISLTPSFIGAQPATYTDASGKTVRPLGDIEDAAFALINTLDATQQKAAVLGNTVIDLVLGPGQDGKTIQSEGLAASQMNASQQAAFLALIGYYTNLANAEDASARNAEIKANLAQTYLAWYGPTTKGSAAYFRVTGPTVVIEYSPQGGGGGGRGGAATSGASLDHIHGIYRDPTNDYGAKYAK
jgi:hypothetical protein